jgi:predicted DNA-binding transcriptional regulator AlpA
MSLEHSPARGSFNTPDASLTINEFCQAEKISRSMLYRLVGRLGPEVLPSRRDASHYPPRASGVAA